MDFGQLLHVAKKNSSTVVKKDDNVSCLKILIFHRIRHFEIKNFFQNRTNFTRPSSLLQKRKNRRKKNVFRII